MITIGKIPAKLNTFFRPVKSILATHAYTYYCNFIMAICVGNASTIERIVGMLRNVQHRTNHGEFLWRSRFDDAAAHWNLALCLLTRLYRKNGGSCMLIIDDTQTIKRAKKMQAVGKIHHHATGKYCMGHTILKACLWYRGVTIPVGSWLYVKKEHAAKLNVPFKKLTELAAEIVLNVQIPQKFNVEVLFDAFYLCPVVAKACNSRKWHFISVCKSNRWLTVDGSRKKIGRYGKNVLQRAGRWYSIRGLCKSSRCRIAWRIGTMKNLGEVKVVFSQRRGDRNFIAIVTDNLGTGANKIVGDYLRRWAIEVMIKEQKQHLGLGDYRVLRYGAIARHLRLVDGAYACLTHVGLAEREKGQRKNENNMQPAPISHLKARMRQIVWQEEIQNVVKVSHEKSVIRRLEKLLAA